MRALVGPGEAGLRSSADVEGLGRWLAGLVVDATARPALNRMRSFLAAHPDALHRSCRAGHFTGSAVVVDAAAERVLLLFHAKHRRWLQPGGHADGDANLAAVAWREATEETGIAGLRIDPHPLDVDVHPIGARPGEPAHVHLDARFLAVAPPGAVPVGNHESTGLDWFAPEALAGLGLDAGTHRVVAAGLARARTRRWSVGGRPGHGPP